MIKKINKIKYFSEMKSGLLLIEVALFLCQKTGS